MSNDIIKILLQAEVEKSSVENIKTQLDGIQRNVKPIKLNVDSTNAVKSISTIDGAMAKVNASNTKTWENASGEVIKYTQTLKNLEKGLTIVDTYMKNAKGGFDFTGRTINDKSVEVTYKALQKAHTEAIKFNAALDETARKNHQMAKDAAWKQYFQGVSETSHELQQLNKYYTQLADGGMEKAHEQAIKLNDIFDKLEQVTKKNLLLDTDKMSNRYKNLISEDDIANVKSMINSLKFDDPNLGHNIDLIKVKMKEVSAGAENSRKSLDLANKSSMSFGEAMKTASYKFGIWSAITASYYKVIREISTGIKFITEMDSALTEIGMVTNQTREQTAGLAKEYNSLAKEMKVLTSEVTSSAVEFYRQGLSQEEVMERMRVSTMYSKIANLEFATSAEVLTATVNSMGIDIERAADVFLYMGDATATSGAEIGKGFQKVGGTASALGMEFEKVASWIAIISSKTRESAESIGTSVNSMLSRISRITQTGFNEDDDTKLNDVAKALDTVGIALTDQTGNFRDFGVIVDDISVKWDTLDDKTQAYIANTIGGVRQQGRFFNLMDGYAESMDLYEESLEAAGTAQEKFSLYLESNQATIDRARTAIESLWLTMLDSDSLMNVVKVFTSFIETLDSMVGKFGVIGTALNFIVPLLGVKLAWAIRSSYIEMLKLNAANANFTSLPLAHVIGGIVKQLFGMEVASKGAAIATGGLTLATAALTAGLTLVPLLIGSIVSAEKRRKQAIEESIEAYNKQKDVSAELDKLTKAYEDLGKETDLTTEQQEKLLEVKEKIKILLPESTSFLDNENLSFAEQVEILKELNTEEKERLRDEAHKQVSRGESAYQRDIKNLETLSARLADWETQQAEYYKKIQDGSISLDEMALYKEISNSMEELREDISETTERIEAYESSLSFLNDEMDNTIDKTDDLADGMDDLADKTSHTMKETIKQIDNFSKSMSTLDSAYVQLISNNQLTASNLSALQEQFGKTDGFEDFIDVVGTTSSVTEEVQEAFNALLGSYLETSEMMDILDEGNKDLIVSKLKLRGVTNAEEIANELLANRTRQLAAEQEVLALETKFATEKGYELTDATWEQINAFLNEQDASEDTRQELARLTLEKITLNNEKLDFGSDIDQIIALANSAGASASALARLSRAKLLMSKYQDPKTGLIRQPKSKEEMDEVFSLSWTIDKIESGDFDFDYTPLNAETYKKAVYGPAVKGGGGSGSRSGGSGSSSSSKEDYKAEADRYAKINLLLDKNNVLLAKNKTLQELAGDDLAKKLPLMEEEISLNKQRQASLHELNNERRKEMLELEKALSGQDFTFQGEGDNRIITNLDNIKGKTKEVEENFKRYIELQSNLLPQASQEWWNLKNTIKTVSNSIQSLTRDMAKSVVEMEKQIAYADLEVRQRKAQAKLDKAKARMERDIADLQSDIDGLQSEIDRIQEQEKARTERLERNKRLAEINQLEAKYYFLQNKNLANLSEEQAKLLGLEEERERYLERQIKLQELQIQLTNTMNEKNIQQLTKKEDGTWDFIYVADQDKIDDINKQIENTQKEHSKSIEKLKETTLDSLQKAQESYDEWERQNEIQRTIEAKQRRIKRYQDEIKDLQDQFAEKEDKTNKAFADEKENLNRHYMDMDILTNEKLEQLKNTHDSNWAAIYNVLQVHFQSIASDYDSLVAKLSTPLPTPSYSGGGGGYYESSSGGGGKGSSGSGSNPTVDAAKYAIDKNIKDWWDADKRGDESAKKKASEQADKIRKGAGLNNYAKTKDEVDKIKKKYGFASGGETDRTGLHWLDGKKGEPERILSPQQTKDFNKLVENIPDVLKFFDSNKLENVLKSAVLSTINVVVPKMPQFALASNSSGGGDQIFNISKVEFPNITTADEATKAIMNLPNRVKQRTRIIGVD